MAQAIKSRLFLTVVRTRLAPSINISSTSSKHSFSSAGHDDVYETKKWKKITIGRIITCNLPNFYDAFSWLKVWCLKHRKCSRTQPSRGVHLNINDMVRLHANTQL